MYITRPHVKGYFLELTANTPQQLRHTNMSAVLSVMRRSGALTGTDLIEATGLARATVIAVCDDLIGAGWVHELPSQRTAIQKGRPARVFEFDARAGVVVGLDFGVAKTTALVADLRGKILAKATESLGEFTAPDSERLASIDAAIQTALAAAGVTPDAVLVAGLGIAAPVDRKGNISHSQPFWENFDIGIQETLRDRYGWPVLLANDANLAAMAERWMGAGAGVDDLAVMLAGERIGFGLMESGRLLHGASGRTGEVGLLHLVEGVGTPEGIALLAREMAVEACKKGAPQTLLTSLTTGTDTSTAAGPEDASIDGDAVGGDGGISAEAVFDAAARGDKVAGHILDTIARRMARVIALIATFNDPELVVIGGAVAASSAVMLPTLQQELAKFMPNPPRVAVSTLGDAIVTLGAVRLALDYVERNALDLVPGS
ncbi:ROK family protein [Arthrobacter sp. GMC3]|uniref:ROK family protein n=2 Tax=unclassified Arthrobacter TaxID=235627 RepID=UPI000CE537A7|nr:ROK family protein [Arthrobacter sp. GMC3]